MIGYVTFIVRHRVAVIVAVLLITTLLATQLRHLRLEIRQAALVPQSHPYVQVHNRIAELFGSETTLLIGVVANRGDVFSTAVLAKIDRITRSIAALPDVVPGNVLSITSPRTKAIRATADGIDVAPLIPRLPSTANEIDELREEVLGDRLYSGTMVAKDGKAALIVADFSGRRTDRDIVQQVESVVAPERDTTTSIFLGGAPVIRASVGRYTSRVAFLFPIAVVLIGFIHYEAFRTLQAMFLPLGTALLSVLWSLGFVGFLNQPMDTWTAVTPLIVLAVAAGHAVQILKRYYEDYATLGDAHLAVVRAVSSVGPVMLTAGLVASAGFLSLITFGVTSVRMFGLLMALGILSALTIEMTFTPACRALLPPPTERESIRERQGGVIRSTFKSIAAIPVRHRSALFLVTAATLGFLALGLLFLRVDNSFRAWFPADSPLRRADTALNQHLAGTTTLTILVEGHAAGDLEEPAVLRAIEDLQEWLGQRAGIGGVTSIVDPIKTMNRAFHANDSSFYSIPERREIVAQYLLLYSFSGPDDLGFLLEPTHRSSVIRAFAKSDEAAFGRELLSDLRQFSSTRFRGLPADVLLAGGALGVQTAMNESIVREKALNLMQVALIIFLLSALALRSVLAGLLVLLPLSVAILTDLGMLGWSGTPLSIATAAITAMGGCIGADFSIYLLFRIREEVRNGTQWPLALERSLSTTGEAIFFVSSAVAVGYLVLPLAGFGLWTNLGFLTALLIGVSALSTVTLVPAVVLIAGPAFLRG